MQRTSTPDTTTGALRRSIVARLEAAGADEIRVMDYLLTRLELGRERYGALDFANRPHDWQEEERQEHADAAVYRACAEIVRLDRDRADLRAAAAKELVEAGLLELRDATAETPRGRFDGGEA